MNQSNQIKPNKSNCSFTIKQTYQAFSLKTYTLSTHTATILQSASCHNQPLSYVMNEHC